VQHTCRFSAVEGGPERGRLRLVWIHGNVSRIAVVGHLDAMVDRPFKRSNHIAPPPEPGVVEHLERIQLHVRCDSHYFCSVIYGGHCPSHVGTVTVVVHRVVVLVHEIPAAGIVG
jgi:hypothetical protein